MTLAGTAAAPAHANGAPRRDAVADALGALEVALESRDEVAPAAQLAEIRERLRAVNAAEAPRKRSRAQASATKALEEARIALHDRGSAALEEVRAAALAFRKAHDLPIPPKPRRRFGLEATLQDLPPPKTICRRLEWDVGRAPMLVGPPGAAKTYLAQQAIVDLVLGRALLGSVDLKPPGPQRVLHVDLDQGRAKTLRRYQRLIRGAGATSRVALEVRHQLAEIAGLDPRDLGRYEVDEGEGLSLMSLQPEELARWRAAWLEAVRGFDAVFVDSLRRLAPFLDENDSRFSIVPDTMRMVSEEADVVTVLLHHASNKRPQGKGAASAPPQTRGSSAIDGAAGTQLAIEKRKGSYHVTQIRAGEAAELESFAFVFENDDEAGPGGVRGVRLRYKTLEQVRGPEKEAKAGKHGALRDRALEWIRQTNLRRGYAPQRKAVATNVEGQNQAIYVALTEMVKEGLLLEVDERDGKRKVQGLWAADVRQREEEAT